MIVVAEMRDEGGKNENTPIKRRKKLELRVEQNKKELILLEGKVNFKSKPYILFVNGNTFCCCFDK